MGAGVSATLKNYVLQGWEGEADAPSDVEQQARTLTRQAFVFAEVYEPAHRHHSASVEERVGGATSSTAPRLRPDWLEPSQLHVLFVSARVEVANFVLAALTQVAPLAVVYSEDNPALAVAAEAGLHSHAFIDPDLRAVRLWCTSYAAMEAWASKELLMFFDVVVLFAEGGPSDAHSQRLLLEKELAEVQGKKKAAIADENFEEAKKFKVRQEELSSAIQALQQPSKTAGEENSKRNVAEDSNQIMAELEAVQSVKRAAVEAEDFEKASSCRRREMELQARQRQLSEITAPAQERDEVNASLECLSCVLEHRLPLLVVGVPALPERIRAATSTAGLPPDSVLSLPHLPGEKLCGCSEFWSLVRKALDAIAHARSFPNVVPALTLPEGARLGAPVRLQSGECGTCIAYDASQKLAKFSIRLWDGGVVHADRSTFAIINFKLGASSPAKLTRMETMWVSLQGLKAKPELNGKEGEAEAKQVNGRHTVAIKGGGTIAVRPENMKVLEPCRQELNDSVGLVDARDPVQNRYKVLVVSTNQGTDARSQVRLLGLAKRSDLNSQEATVNGFNPETGRYKVRLASGDEIAIRRINFAYLEPLRITARSLSLRPECVDYFLDPEEEGKLFEM